MTAAEIERLGRRLWDERSHLMRFLLSRVLRRTGLAERLALRVAVADGVPVWFSRTALATTLWVDPTALRVQRRLVQELVDEGSSVVDIGANIGVLALVAGRAVGERGVVVAVEPSPQVFRALSKNVETAGMTWVRCLPCAIGEAPGEARLTRLSSDDQNSVTDSPDGTPVALSTLDDVAAGLTEISLVKIDVEGYEESVLAGGQRTLPRARHVLMEVAPSLLARYGSSPAPLLSTLRGHGFELIDAETGRVVSASWPHLQARDILASRDVGRAQAAIAAARADPVRP